MLDHPRDKSTTRREEKLPHVRSLNIEDKPGKTYSDDPWHALTGSRSQTKIERQLIKFFTWGGGGGSAPKKRDFLVKNFQKVPKNAFDQKTGTKSRLGRDRKIKSVDLKNFEFFLKIRPPPPRENPRSAPACQH